MRTVLPRLGSEASLDSLEVDSRPATLLQIGRVGGVTARSTVPAS
jgi:hypothetical protein